MSEGKTSKASGSKRPLLGRTSLLRDVYRSLLNSGRTYAGFRNDDVALVEQLASMGTILDPMSGYGGTTAICAALGVRSWAVEFNPPQYFWQYLSHPANVDLFAELIAMVRASRRRWPKPRSRAIVSGEFFPSDLFEIQTDLFALIHRSASRVAPERAEEFSIALQLPFSGRLACTSPSDVSTHTREGGIAVLSSWDIDFADYLDAVAQHIARVKDRAKEGRHKLQLGDARTVKFGGTRFSAMLTSPPYPNHRDFTAILLPENVLLQKLAPVVGLSIPFDRKAIIGSNFVSGKTTSDPKSVVAQQFLRETQSLKRTSRGKYDDEVYYVPYFKSYFTDLEMAYTNIAKYAATKFEGFIVVVNNTHRGRIIPVAEVIIDIWRMLGFDAEVARSRESSHFGAKNPRAKGIRARHTEYVVRAWR